MAHGVTALRGQRMEGPQGQWRSATHHTHLGAAVDVAAPENDASGALSCTLPNGVHQVLLHTRGEEKSTLLKVPMLPRQN